MGDGLDFEYTEAMEIADVFGMFLAGTDTTSLRLEWGLILLAKQQRVQQRVREELQSVIKYKSSKSTYDMKMMLQLPLFRALVWEILRISCVVRLGLEHMITERDEWITTDDGNKYRLPKGSKIRYNVECMHYNYLGNENWKNEKHGLIMQEICLDNWLKDGMDKPVFMKNSSFIGFGAGKRDCVGQQLALKELRVIVGYLLMNYTFALPDEYKAMKYIEPYGGITIGVF